MKSSQIAILAAAILASIPVPAFADCEPAYKASHCGLCPDQDQSSCIYVGKPAKDIVKPNPDFDTDCGKEIQMDSELDGSMQHVKPPKDQDGAGICYGEAASQMIDAWRFSHGETNYDHKTSAIATAIMATKKANDEIDKANESIWFDKNKQKKAATPDGGFICQAANEVLEQGTCDERSVLEKSGTTDLKKFIVQFSKLYNDYHEWASQRSKFLTALDVFVTGGNRMMEESDRLGHAIGKLEQCMVLSLKFRKEMIPPMPVMKKLFQQSDPLVFLRGVMLEGCKKGHQYKPASFEGHACRDEWRSTSDPKDINKDIHNLLKQNPAEPVAITFCASSLTHDASYRGVDRKSGKTADDCGNHAALIIGQRKDPTTGRCQFQVRNSWGGSCAHYRWCVEQPKKKDGMISCKSEGWPCTQGEGDLWVDAESLSGNIYGLHYVK